MADPTQASEVTVSVEGRDLRLRNLDKVLYPETGTTKAEVVTYYANVAPVMLRHLRGRPVTLRRFPDGTGRPGFYAKNVPPGTPHWVRRVPLASPGSTRSDSIVTYVLVDDTATLIWSANLAGLELHVPQWRLGPDDGPLAPDLLVVDLDPGPPAGIAECCAVALAARTVLAGDGLIALPRTSGSKGLQLSARLADAVARPALGSGAPLLTAEAVIAYARDLALVLESALSHLVVSRMTRSVRTGKVFVDWSQNNPAKTTVAPYSLRAKPSPTVATPVTWDEVTAAAQGATDLVFRPSDVLERVNRHGDLLASLVDGP